MTAPSAIGSVASEAQSTHLLAKRLVAREARGSGAAGGAASAAFAACQSTYSALARSIGAAGADALLSRALSMTETKHPLLRELSFAGDNEEGLCSLRGASDKHGASVTSAGLVALLESFLALLERFVGIDMVAQLVAQSATIGTREDEDTQ